MTSVMFQTCINLLDDILGILSLLISYVASYCWLHIAKIYSAQMTTTVEMCFKLGALETQKVVVRIWASRIVSVI